MSTVAEQTLVICGHGMVAQRLLEKLVGQRQQSFSRIVVFNGESTPAYNRIQLSALLAGDASEDSLQLQEPEWYRQHNITVYQGDPVTEINRAKSTVYTASGRVQPYTHLVIATGSRSAPLGLEGEDLAGGALLKDALSERGLTIHTRTSPVALLGRNLVRAVQLDNETLISTDLVVIAAGITPNTESVVWQDYETNRYCRLLVRNQRLTGAVLFGETSDGPWYSERIQQADDISPYRAQLAFGKHYCEAA